MKDRNSELAARLRDRWPTASLQIALEHLGSSDHSKAVSPLRIRLVSRFMSGEAGTATESGMGQVRAESDAEELPRAGQVLGRKYRLVSVLGEGNMGVVWLAEHLALRSPVALKLMRPLDAREPGARARFVREARIASALRSPHVVQILDYGVDASTAYIVMERLEGESLGNRIERLGCLGAGDTVRVISHVARALSRAHEIGIVHRDLKPHNIFLVDNDDEEIAKVLDFGIAIDARSLRSGASSGDALTKGLVGTPQYMSPEQTQGAENIDCRADIWALGVIAFECLVGHPPFVGNDASRILMAIHNHPLPVPSASGAVPTAFDAWFERACAREPAQRFASARAAAHELERLFIASWQPAPASIRAPLVSSAWKLLVIALVLAFLGASVLLSRRGQAACTSKPRAGTYLGPARASLP